MTNILLVIYLIIGLLMGHYYFKKATKSINDEIENGEIGNETEDIISRTNQLSSAIGHKNFMVIAYIMFAIVWLPALIYVKFIKKMN